MRGLKTLVIVLLLTVPALAQKEVETPNNNTNDSRARSEPITSFLAFDQTGTPRGGMEYMEDFEDFTLGVLGTQGGWSQFPGVVEVVAPGIQGQSVRHASDGFGFSGTDIFSPIFVRDFHTFAQQVTITGGGGNASTYVVSPVDSVEGIVNTRVVFEANGDITVAQLAGDRGSLVFVDTGFNWSSGTAITLQVNTYANGLLEVMLDGSVAFTGEDVVFAVTGNPGQTDNFEYFSDNVGLGDFDGTGATMTIDNLTTNPITVPTLGEWGMMAFVLVLMASGVFFLRRRRLAA